MTEVPIMVMPWHRPDPCKPLKMQTDAAFKSNYLDYLSTLRLDSPPLDQTLTTVAGTIGPSSNHVDMLVDLMSNGLSIALVPLALGTRQEQIDTIANIRTANTSFSNMKDMVYPLGIAVQTKGPGLRLGGLVKDMPITLNLHHKVTLTNDKAWRTKGTDHYLYVNFPEMCHVLTEGDILLLGNGVVLLQVDSVEETEVKCVVVGNGTIQSFMAVSVPDVPLELPPLTDEDVDDLRMAADLNVDIVVVSKAQSDELVRDVRRILDEQEGGSGIKIWAQIESNQALKNLECILKVADAIVFSRISLLQDIPAEKLFLAQKLVVATCNKAGVPVFVSSHFLPSMQVSTTPSIAEVYDVTAAILDGVDGFLMRNTVSHGKHPDLAVKTLVGVCVEAEAAVWHHQTFNYLNEHMPAPIDPTHSIAIAAVEASLKSSASVILLATTSGRSAQLVARYRPRCPIIAVTRYGQVARQLNSWRAVIPLQYVDPPLPEWTREVDIRFQFAIEFAKHKGIVKPGDVMVLLNGWRKGAGFTNTIRIVYASDSFPWVYPHKLPGSIPSDSAVKKEEEDSEAGGEPDATESRTVTINVKESTSIKSESLQSRVEAMEKDFKTVVTTKSKEIEDKMLESLESMRKTQLRKKSEDKVRSKVDREHSSFMGSPRDTTTKSDSRVTRPSTDALHKSAVGESGSLLASDDTRKSSMMSTKKPATVVSTKLPTVIETEVPNPDVVSEVINEENYEEEAQE